MKYTPPFSVCRSFDGRENDDHTNTNLRVLLTRPCGGNEAIQEECDLAHLFATKQNSQMYRPRSLSLPDQILIDTVPLQEKQRQELIHLKLRIAQQKEKLGILSSKLSQSQVENEVLKAEKTAFIDELAFAMRDPTAERSISSSTAGGFSIRGRFGIGANNGNGGSMKMLLDTNAKLMTEIARLQVSEDGIRKSFQSYIKDRLRSSSDTDMQTIKTLQRENELLQQRLSASEKSKLEFSERTAKTSLESSYFTKENQEELLAIDSSQHSTKDNVLMISLHPTPEQEFKSGTSGDDDWVIEGKDIEASTIGAIYNKAARSNSMPTTSQETTNAIAKGPAARSKSETLLVDFGETETRRSKRVDDRRIRHSLTEGTARSKYDILLVGFGEVRRTFYNKAARRNSMPTTSQETANAFAKGPAARSMSEALLVDFGETENRRRKRAYDRRICHSLTGGTARSKYGILLVGSGRFW
eukprot:CAMPEP_0201881658 /NCGR_PEP_ID=MMETSP0902-20130614/11901_1 /ASSEMBLY_ACC=CAM_ASM_000551 /TAXON_ID=420261 /ORGANISM="Thalassiosira antarctica, Strain CCMP982" /LENGTH=470 /DNA_ID=CAMNT_0048409921 /DNA_START=160 /DNA_END=1572 /DNA_ORIENTATION=+